MRRKHIRGLTLLELLITITIAAGISLAIVATFTSGLRVYQYAKTYGTIQADCLITLEKIERDLRNVFIFSGIDFIGDSSQISFPGIIEQTDEYDLKREEVGRILYYFDSEEKACVKENQTYPDALSELSLSAGETHTLATLESMQFSYFCYNPSDELYEWKDIWEEDEGTPLGVKVVMTYKEGKRTYSLERTVFLPIMRY